jgi:hypothetical protein
MNSIKSKYSLCQIPNNYSQVLVSGTTRNIGEPGIIWVPWTIQSSGTIIVEGDMRYWIRIAEVRKRREKIEKIISKMK